MYKYFEFLARWVFSAYMVRRLKNSNNMNIFREGPIIPPFGWAFKRAVERTHLPLPISIINTYTHIFIQLTNRQRIESITELKSCDWLIIEY